MIENRRIPAVDPNLCLEDVAGAKAIDWVKELTGDPRYEPPRRSRNLQRAFRLRAASSELRNPVPP